MNTHIVRIRQLERGYDELRTVNNKLQKRLNAAEALCAKQATDEDLWFFPHHASEAYLQAALRELHKAVEGSTLTPASAPAGRKETGKPIPEGY